MSKEEELRALTEDLGQINLEDVKEEEIIEKEPAPSQLKSDVVSFNEEYKNMLYERLTQFGKDENNNIIKEQTLNRNLPFAFLGMGELGEELSLYMYPNSFGMASKGGIAFDNLEYKDNDDKLKENNIKLAREIKFVCLDGSKSCKKCNNKAPRFQEKCVLCENNTFDLKADSRAGIQTKEHFKYIDLLQEYIIFVSQYVDDNKTISIKCFKFLSSNTYFNTYLKKIKDDTQAGHANFLPFSFDWHMSGPMLLFDLNIEQSGAIKENYFNLDNTTIQDFPLKLIMPQDIACLDETQKEKYNNIISTNTKLISYEDATSLFSIRKKHCGKSRGVVSRSVKKPTTKKITVKKDNTKEANKTKKSPSSPK